MKTTKLLAMLLVLTLVAGLLAGCGNKSAVESGKNDAAAAHTSHLSAKDLAPLADVTPAESYDQVRSLLYARYARNFLDGGMGGYDAVAETAAAEMAAEEPAAVADDPGAFKSTYGVDNYGTNVQVAGIDEADSVKTDGKYLYILDGTNVNILLADGADTRVVTTLETGLDGSENDDESVYYNGSALLLYGDRLALVYVLSRWGWDDDDNWYNSEETHLAVYDVSDRTQPKPVSDVGQDGYFNCARMKDGVIYLVTSQWVYDLAEDAAPEAYIPRVYTDGSAKLLDAKRIYLCPSPDSSAFTVVGSYDFASGAQTDACAFTDSTDTVYMNADALYLARSVQQEEASEPYTENHYNVVDYISTAVTEIKRIPLAGELSMDKSVQLPGSVLNQFALDVYNGFLRVATTDASYSYSVFTDPNYGFENYLWPDESSRQSNRVTVLDGDLKVVGELDGLAEGEQIYSVRFLGEVGYVVTYESIDPVFTIDLSDPENPTLQSALEVSGVSQYLHSFSDGRLFGFGQALNEDQASDGLQLSMFDVSDPKNVTLEGKTVIENCYSQALYSHHAILVSGAENLIGFPMEDYKDWSCRYVLYTYDNGSFTQRGTVSMDYYPDGARGIPIDGKLYICSAESTFVIDLASYALIATLTESVG